MHNKKGSQIDIAVLDFSKDFDTVLRHRWQNMAMDLLFS